MANNGSGRWGRRPPSRGRPGRTRSQTIGTTMNSSTTRRLPDGRRIVSTEEFKMLLAARLNFDTENGLLPRSITPGRVGMDQGGMETPNRIGMTSRRNGQKRWPSSNRRGKAKNARALSSRQTPYSRPQSASPGRRVLIDQLDGGRSSSGGESDSESPKTSTSQTKSSQGFGLGKGKGKMDAPTRKSSTSSDARGAKVGAPLSPGGAQSGSDEETRRAIALSLKHYYSKAGEAPSREDDSSLQEQDASTQNAEDGQDRKPIPLVNIGNTCYMNSALQTLIAADDFNFDLVEFVEEAKEFSAGVVEFPVANAYLELYTKYLEHSNLPNVDGKVFGTLLKRFQYIVHRHIRQDWKKGREQDVTELLGGVLQYMSNDLVDLGAGGGNEVKNSVQNYFQILSRDRSLCQNCGAEEETPVEQIRLILPFPSEHTQPEAVNLNYIVQRYLEPEEIIADCETCSHKTKTKTAAFLRLPKYLIISLNRFFAGKDSKGIYNTWKILTPVTAGGSITTTCIGSDGSPAEVKYAVFCGVVHIGNTISTGHYISYVFNPQNCCWYACNDLQITNIGKGFPRDLSQGYYFICEREQEDNEEQEGSEGQEEGEAGSS